jgi:hypothetical protein
MGKKWKARLKVTNKTTLIKNCAFMKNSMCVHQKKPFFFFFFGGGRVLARQVLHHLSHSTSPFSVRYFQNMVLRSICPGWL